jgi:hypothetical protein
MPTALTAAELYLDLMKKILINTIYQDDDIDRSLQSEPGSNATRSSQDYDQRHREVGLGWPRLAHTMVGLKRLDNLKECIETVLADDVKGDFVETGVWRGGACIMMRAILAAHGVTDRNVWVADSFEGMPASDGADGFNDVLAVSETEVRENFKRYDLLDEKVKFLHGWFRDTLPAAPISRLAVLRLDGDLYESTMDALGTLYPKLSAGGFVIVDDYAIEPCAKAVDDFREANGILDPITKVDWTGAYWRRSE